MSHTIARDRLDLLTRLNAETKYVYETPNQFREDLEHVVGTEYLSPDMREALFVGANNRAVIEYGNNNEGTKARVLEEYEALAKILGIKLIPPFCATERTLFVDELNALMAKYSLSFDGVCDISPVNGQEFAVISRHIRAGTYEVQVD